MGDGRRRRRGLKRRGAGSRGDECESPDTRRMNEGKKKPKKSRLVGKSIFGMLPKQSPRKKKFDRSIERGENSHYYSWLSPLSGTRRKYTFLSVLFSFGWLA